MKLYKSCNTLSIARFFRIIETGDIRHLIKDYDYENDEINLTDLESIELNKLFDNIFFEYSEITGNLKLKTSLKKQFLINEWEFIYVLITNLISIYTEHSEIETLSILNNLKDDRYKVDLEKPIPPQVKQLQRKMKGLKNKIVLFKLKLSESAKNDKKEVKVDLDADALYMEKNLELKRAIDPETTSVSRWVTIINLSRKQTKASRNGATSRYNK